MKNIKLEQLVEFQYLGSETLPETYDEGIHTHLNLNHLEKRSYLEFQ